MANKFEASLNTPKTPENGADVEVMEGEIDSVSKPEVSLEETKQIKAEDAAKLQKTREEVLPGAKSLTFKQIAEKQRERDEEKAKEREVMKTIGKHFVQKFTEEANNQNSSFLGRLKANFSVDRVKIAKEAQLMPNLFAMLSYMEKKGLRVSDDSAIQEIGAGVMGAEKFSAYFNRGTSKQEEFEEKHIKKDIASMGGHSFGSGE